ncbi:hypothetical protein AK812_SmicGene40588 [Symbiodinium microadriaticum]|uniref:Uncharacterized protein n=1 Tax=Symbiodinium microadriaticum TaxID=2951 RepID=A0A1Q9C8A3_SYMMI|nr:hypothetical protein AK812_SmicGene40588 [Symbiodinium microadriaticum]
MTTMVKVMVTRATMRMIKGVAVISSIIIVVVIVIITTILVVAFTKTARGPQDLLDLREAACEARLQMSLNGGGNIL